MNKYSAENDQKDFYQYYDTNMRKNFGIKIKEYRRQLDISAREFVEQYNNAIQTKDILKFPTYVSWERGAAFPKNSRIIGLYLFYHWHGLNVSMDDLFIYPDIQLSPYNNTPEDFYVYPKTMGDFYQYSNAKDIRLINISLSDLLKLNTQNTTLFLEENTASSINECAQKLQEITVNQREKYIVIKETNQKIQFENIQGKIYYNVKLPNDNEIMSILSLTDAKKEEVVWIEYIDANPITANTLSGYYRYIEVLKAFCNDKLDIRLSEMDYMKRYFAVQDFNIKYTNKHKR